MNANRPPSGTASRIEPTPVGERPDQSIGSADHTVWSTPAGRLLARSIHGTSDWLHANLVLAAFLVAGVAVLWLGTWGGGEVYESVQADNGLALVDQPMLQWVLSVRTPPLNQAIAFFSNTGGPVLQPIITGIVVLFLSWRWRSWTPLVLVVLAEGGALLMTIVGKHITGRSRPPLTVSIPPHEYSASFPSGHTLNATVIAGVLCYLMLHWFRHQATRVAWVAVAALYAVAMGLSRVYLGHHWFTDVVAGWLYGAAWLGVVITLHRLWLTARAKHGPQRWDEMLASS